MNQIMMEVDCILHLNYMRLRLQHLLRPNKALQKLADEIAHELTVELSEPGARTSVDRALGFTGGNDDETSRERR